MVRNQGEIKIYTIKTVQWKMVQKNSQIAGINGALQRFWEDSFFQKVIYYVQERAM